MDELLKKDISVLPSERRELFLFLGRFQGYIGRFNAAYGDIWAKRANDIASRTRDAQNLIASMEQRHLGEVRKMDNELNLAVTRKNNEVTQAQKQRDRSNADEDTKYKNWEQLKSNELNNRDRVDHEMDDEDANRVNEMLAAYSLVKRSMKKRIGAVTKDIKARDCLDTADAQSRFDAAAVAKVQSIKDEILKIHNSLPRMIFFFAKRDELCRELSQLIQDAKKACAFVKNERKRLSTERWTAFQEEKRRRQLDTINQKKTNDLACKRTEDAVRNQITSLQNIYAQKKKSLIATQNSEKQQRKAQLDKEKKEAETKWNGELLKTHQSFVIAFENQFPAKLTMEMMRKAWKSPQNFTAMLQNSAQENVLVGFGCVNAKKWYEGEGGRLVRELMEKKYPFLFYPVSNGKGNQVNTDVLRLPYTLSLDQGENLLIKCEDSLLNQMEAAVHAIAMRFLWAIPAGQAQLLLGDPAAIGSFTPLTALDPAVDNTSGTTTVRGILDGGRVCSTVSEIRQRIQDNTARYNSSSGQMGSVKSLREYNKANPMNTRSFLLSIIQKFPSGLDEESIQSLRKMGADCGKWGFSSILCGTASDFQQVDKKIRPALTDLLQNCVYFEMHRQPGVGWAHFEVKGSDLPLENGCRVFFSPQPDAKTCVGMKNLLRSEMMRAGSKKIDFEQARDICPAPSKRYTETAKNGIVIPVGYWDGGTPFHMIFDDSRVHALINGDTGMGKTNLLHVLITNTMLRYSPEEVEMYLIDFKHGTEFRRYTTFKLPAFRMISLCNEPEFALKMLRGIKKELLRREKLFGNSITSLKSYIEKTGKKMSRILLIIDELYQMVEETKSIPAGNVIRDEIIKFIKEFAVQARAYGIHMIISGQNLTNISEMQVIKNSCATRIALRCSEQQVTGLIDQEAAKQMRMINPEDKGACVVRAGQGVPSQIEHTAYIEPDKQHIRLLGEINNHYAPIARYPKARVMATDARTDHEGIYQRFVLKKDLSDVRLNRFMLGEILTNQVVEEIDLTRKNLWITGGQSEDAEKAGNSLCFYFLFSLLLHRRICQNQMSVFFIGSGDEGDFYNWNPCVKLARELPNQVSLVPEDRTEELLAKVYQEMLNRRLSRAGHGFSPMWLILQKPEELQFRNMQVFQMLQELLQFGPEYGIQTMIWTADLQKAAPMQVSKVQFGEKIALEMDSSAYTAVLGIKPKVESKGWYANLTKEGRMRVYDLPEEDWVNQIIARLKEA